MLLLVVLLLWDGNETVHATQGENIWDIHKKCTAQTSMQVHKFRKAQLAVFACSHNLLSKTQKVVTFCIQTAL